MADRSVSDQPSLYTLDQLRELYEDSEGHLAMLDAVEVAAKGAEIALSLTDGEQVRYVWDGGTYLFRADTKAAQVLRSEGERAVKKHG